MRHNRQSRAVRKTSFLILNFSVRTFRYNAYALPCYLIGLSLCLFFKRNYWNKRGKGAKPLTSFFWLSGKSRCGLWFYPTASCTVFEGITLYGRKTKKPTFAALSCKADSQIMVEVRGVEPLASWMPFKRSTNWAIPPKTGSKERASCNMQRQACQWYLALFF